VSAGKKSGDDNCNALLLLLPPSPNACAKKTKAPGKKHSSARGREREQTTETLFPRVVEKDQNLDTHAKPTTTRLSLYFHLQIQIRHVEKITCSPAILANRNTTVKMKEWVGGVHPEANSFGTWIWGKSIDL
jgi:hypothetical protein